MAIGNAMGEFSDAVLKVGRLQGMGAVDKEGNAIEENHPSGGKKNVTTVPIDIISGIMAPTIPLLDTSAIIKGVLKLLTFLHILDARMASSMWIRTMAAVRCSVAGTIVFTGIRRSSSPTVRIWIKEDLYDPTSF